jgi:hypothetical protein
VKTQASEKPSGVPVEEIMKQIYDAASSSPVQADHHTAQADHHPATDPVAISLKVTLRATQIEKALKRASRKSFVRAVKPLRRLFRNQGAVNDSLIEGLSQLFAQTQVLIEEIGELQGRVSMLEAQLRQLRSGQPVGATKPAAE